MTDTIPDHVGREAVRLLNADLAIEDWAWPDDSNHKTVITVAKLLINPPTPMPDPDEEALRRVIVEYLAGFDPVSGFARATEQMRKEFAARKEAWEAGRS